MQLVWGYAVAGFAAVGFVIAGAALTMYDMLEPWLPKEWQSQILPNWLGPCIFVASLLASYAMTFLAFHRLRLRTGGLPAETDQKPLTIDARPDHVKMTGNPTLEQIREVFKGASLNWSPSITQAQERDSESEREP